MSRHPSGPPSGGQFAADAKTEAAGTDKLLGQGDTHE